MNKQQYQNTYDLVVIAIAESYQAGLTNQCEPVEKLKAIKQLLLPDQLDSDEPKTDYQNFNEFLKKNAPNLLKMKEPVTDMQYKKLCELSNKKLLVEVIANMSNWQPLLRKNISAYKTIINWYNKDSHGKQNTGTADKLTSSDRGKAIIERTITDQLNGYS